MKSTVRSLTAGLALLVLSPSLVQAAHDLQVAVVGSDTAHRHVPLKVRFTLPEELRDAEVLWLSSSDNEPIMGQLTGISLLGDAHGSTQELHFVVPDLDQGERHVDQVSLATPSDTSQFHWTNRECEYAQLTVSSPRRWLGKWHVIDLRC